VGLFELLLDLLLELVVGRDVALVRRVGRASTARDGPNKTAEPVDDHGAGIAFVGESIVLARLGVVAEDDDFDRVDLEAVVGVLACFGLQAVDASKGGARRATVLDGQECLDVVDVVVLGIVELVLANVVLELKKKVVGDVEVARVVRLSKHVRFPVGGGLVSACPRGIDAKRSEGKKSKNQNKENRCTDIQLVALKVSRLQLVRVELDQRPVVHIAVLADFNLGRMIDETEGARAGEGVALGDGGVEFVRCRDRLLGLVDEADELVASIRARRGLVVRLRRDPA